MPMVMSIPTPSKDSAVCSIERGTDSIITIKSSSSRSMWLKPLPSIIIERMIVRSIRLLEDVSHNEKPKGKRIQTH